MKKYCNFCKQEKDISDFSKHKRGIDGLYFCCKLCTKEKRMKNSHEYKNVNINIKCSKCNKEKPATPEFFGIDKSKTLGLQADCRECHRLGGKERYQKQKERLKKLNIKWKKENPIKRYASSLKYKYNITIEDYNRMLLEQNNCCDICGGEERKINYNNKIQVLSVDHNHRTGKVRALLCHRCNAIVGFREHELNDKVEKYLLKHSEDI